MNEDPPARSESEPELELERHGLGTSVLLHLWPGVFVSLVYLVIVQPLRAAGIPALVALGIAYIGIVPAELGLLLYLGKKRNGRLSLRGIVCYREKLVWWHYLLWVPGLIVISGALMMALAPLSDWTQANLFSWVPSWVLQDPAKGETYARGMVIVSAVVVGVLLVVVYPIIEELYFRGYLMPRLAHQRDGGVVTSALLFGVYHFLMPWSLPARFVALLPVLWVVKRKRNIYLVMVVHILGNVSALAAILALWK